jgi:hypothetical protein
MTTFEKPRGYKNLHHSESLPQPIKESFFQRLKTFLSYYLEGYR